MSLYEQAKTEKEYLDILERVVYDLHPNSLKCLKCGELLINLIHAKYHHVKQHGKDWQEAKGEI